MRRLEEYEIFRYDKRMDELIRELKRQGVLKSPYTEAAFRAIDRKEFVPPEMRAHAYANHPLPIGHGQTISQPYTVAFMLDLLGPKPGEKILDIGAGSGWQTALLAHVVSSEQRTGNKTLPGKIVAIERIPELCAFARNNLAQYEFLKKGTVKLMCGDARESLGQGALFDGIIAAAASNRAIPESWKAMVRPGGRIVAPIGESLWRYTKHANGTWSEEEFPGFAFVPLVSGESREQRVENGGKKNRLPRRYFFSFVILYPLFSILLAYAAYATFTPKPIMRTEIEITNGMGSRTIGTFLKTQDLVRSKWTFVAYATLTGNAPRLKPGLYAFEHSVTIPEIVHDLVNGETNERIITIPEGWNLADIASYFEASGMFSSEAFWNTAGYPPSARNTGNRRALANYTNAFPFLAERAPDATLEGFLFPDTYRIYRTATSSNIVIKMLENFQAKVVEPFGEEILASKKTLLEIITIASLVEKEAATTENQELVAGILWKRLEHGIPLQVDATIHYITGKGGIPNANDLKEQSPYNTYLNRGLPPGPIANPGLRAIRSSLSPTESPYLYYLSRPDGAIIYSKTLEEHNAAKAQYLRR